MSKQCIEPPRARKHSVCHQSATTRVTQSQCTTFQITCIQQRSSTYQRIQEPCVSSTSCDHQGSRIRSPATHHQFSAALSSVSAALSSLSAARISLSVALQQLSAALSSSQQLTAALSSSQQSTSSCDHQGSHIRSPATHQQFEHADDLWQESALEPDLWQDSALEPDLWQDSALEPEPAVPRTLIGLTPLSHAVAPPRFVRSSTRL